MAVKSNFREILRKIISENKLTPLHGSEWSKMGDIERKLDHREMGSQEAVNEFLKQSDYRKLSGNRSLLESMKRAIEHNIKRG